jgi:hypothetical protein
MRNFVCSIGSGGVTCDASGSSSSETVTVALWANLRNNFQKLPKLGVMQSPLTQNAVLGFCGRP